MSLIPPPRKKTFDHKKAEFIRQFILNEVNELKSESQADCEINFASNIYDKINKVCRIKTKDDDEKSD